LTRGELSTVHLDSPNSGDVFAQAALGYALTDWRGNPNVVEAATYFGQHGYDSTLLEMRAVFIAAGMGLDSGATLPPIHLLDAAPTVATLLGLSPPDTMQGRVLHEALR
jgi:predicted AlkP superfamily pyrophosphatase or phosphodiesterase